MPMQAIPTERKTHVLKTWTEFIDPILDCAKTFEVRKNDRDFRIGDILHLREWNPNTQEWGSRSVTCFVTYVLHGPAFGVQDGYVVMGLQFPKNHVDPRTLLNREAP